MTEMKPAAPAIPAIGGFLNVSLVGIACRI